jgi:hypothetical protein
VGDLESGVRHLGLSPQRPAYTTPHFFFIDHEDTIVREIDRARNPELFSNEKEALAQAIEELLGSAPETEKTDSLTP